MSDQQPPTPNRQVPFSDAFKEFIKKGWAADPTELPDQLPSAPYAARRRQAISAQFPGDRLVIPAGGLKVRSNDTDYRFRPHSAFAHLTGLGTDQEPDAVLVLDPTDDGHDATVYFFFGTHWRAPLVLVVLAAFAGGLVVGALGMLPGWWKHRSAAAQLPAAPVPSVAAAPAAPAAATDLPAVRQHGL